jgi:hypothetical protein
MLGRKLLNINVGFDFLHSSCLKHFSFREFSEMLSHMYNASYSCQKLQKLELSWQILQQYSNIKFRENPSGGSRVVPCGGRTDGQKYDEANNRVRNFANVRKSV